MTAGMPSAVAARAEAFVLTEGPAWGRQVDVGVCEVGRETARRLGLPDSTQQALYHAYESWVGGWAPDGLRGDDIAIGSRVARAALDAAVFDQLGGAEAAVAALRQRAGVILDPAVVAVFAEDPRGILAEADDGDPRRPGPRGRARSGRRAHRGPARRGGRGVRRPRRHQGAVPPRSLEGGGPPGRRRRPPAGAGRRRGRSHRDRRPPARRRSRRCLQRGVGEAGAAEPRRVGAGADARLLLRADPGHRPASLAPIATMAGMHHERLDGSGYHRCSEAVAVPMAARLLAAADAFAAMTRARPHRPALSDDQAAHELLAEADGRALRPRRRSGRAGRGRSPGRSPAPTRPAGLSEREAEVLTLIAAGCTQRRGGDPPVHLPPHRRAPRPAHLRQDRRVDACRRRAVRRPARPGERPGGGEAGG